MKNPANKILLWLFLLPATVYRRLGVDMIHLRAILTAKLTMDDRRTTGFHKMRRQSSEKEISTATLLTIFMALFMGATILLTFLLKDDLTRMTFYFAFFGFVLSMFLITDFSDILIDPKDNYIILPKPVSSATFTVARLIHLLIHMSKIVIPMAIPGLVVIGISRGILGVLGFIICIPLLTLFTFFIVNAAYLLIIRIFSPAKLNSIITSMQIVFSVILYGSYQVLPRLLDQSELENMVLYSSNWFWLIPTYWFAKAWIFFHTFSFQLDLILGVVLSIAVPLVGLWMVIRFLAPAFFRKLSLIHADSVNEKTRKKNETRRYSGATDFATTISKLWTKTGPEREAFLFTWRMTSRSRDFKMRVYPQVGYMLVLLFLFGFRSWKHILLMDNGDFGGIDDRAILFILSIIYISGFIFMGAILQLAFTENFKSAWVYYIAPVTQPGQILRGAIKACLSKFFFPIALVVILSGLILFGTAVIPNFLFGFGNVWLMCNMLSWLAMDRLPFSISIKNQKKGEISTRNIFMLIALPIFGIPHYFLFHHPIILSGLSVITITAGTMILLNTRKISWKYIKEA